MSNIEVIHAAPGIRLLRRPRLCGRAGCDRLHPPTYELVAGDLPGERTYVGPTLESARDQLPLLVDDRLVELGELPVDADVRELADAAKRASGIFAASRVYLRQEGEGLDDTDVLVLPRSIVERLAGDAETVIAMLPVLGTDQRALVEEVRAIFAGAGIPYVEGLGGALHLRRRVAASVIAPLEPLVHYLDTRMRVFASAPKGDVLERLLALDATEVAKRLRAERQRRRSAEDAHRPPRRVRLTTPLVLEVCTCATTDRLARLDRTSGAALLVLNEELSMAARGESRLLPFRVARPLQTHILT